MTYHLGKIQQKIVNFMEPLSKVWKAIEDVKMTLLGK